MSTRCTGQVSKVLFCPACGAPAVKWVQAVEPRSFWATSCHHAVEVRRIPAAQLQMIRRDYAASLGQDANTWIATCEGKELPGPES